MNKRLAILTLLMLITGIASSAGERYNFNADWKLALGKEIKGSSIKIDDSQWKRVTLPYAWNQEEAFAKACGDLSDTIMWYRKHFLLPKTAKGKKIFHR